MKWFKHMSNAKDDDFIEWLEDNYGFEGYGRWWRILECIASSMEKNRMVPEAVHTWTKWQRFLRGKRSQLLDYLLAIQLRGKIKLEYNELVLKITCPKMLKMRDEYARKSGHYPDEYPDSVAPDTDTDKEKDISPKPPLKKQRRKRRKSKPDSDKPQLFKNEELPKQIPTQDAFDRFWKIYPKKVDKPDAITSWMEAVKRADPEIIIRGAQAYAEKRRNDPQPDRHKFTRGPVKWLDNDSWENEESSEDMIPLADIPAEDKAAEIMRRKGLR